MKIVLQSIKFILSNLYMIATVTFAVMIVMGSTGLDRSFYDSLGLKVTEKVRGGEIIKELDHHTYRTRIHTPVFEGPFRESKKGFVQIDWFSRSALPERISEEIDYDGDGQKDFKIILLTEENRATLTSYNENVQVLLDKSTISSLFLQGYKDGRNAVFFYKDYEEALFLGYSMDELDKFDKIKELVMSEEQPLFDTFINGLAEAKGEQTLELKMINKVDKRPTSIALSYTIVEDCGYREHKLLFKLEDSRNEQQLELTFEPQDLEKIYTAYPRTAYKSGKSVRVLLRK